MALLLGDAMKEFADYLQSRGFAQNTIDSYVFASRQLISKVAVITDQNLLSHKDWLLASFAPKTANNRIGAINAYLDYIDYGGLRLKGVRIQQKPFLDNVISNDEYLQLRNGLKQDGKLTWYFLIRFLACTGARVSEVRQFEVRHVTAGYMDLVSKGQKLRRIWIPETLATEAKRWVEGRIGTTPLFSGPNGAPISSRGIALGLKRAARDYGVNPEVVYPHSFRHLFAKNFIQRNPDIALLADLMGHESIETTRIYLRRTATEQRIAVDKAIIW